MIFKIQSENVKPQYLVHLNITIGIHGPRVWTLTTLAPTPTPHAVLPKYSWSVWVCVCVCVPVLDSAFENSLLEMIWSPGWYHLLFWSGYSGDKVWDHFNLPFTQTSVTNTVPFLFLLYPLLQFLKSILKNCLSRLVIFQTIQMMRGQDVACARLVYLNFTLNPRAPLIRVPSEGSGLLRFPDKVTPTKVQCTLRPFNWHLHVLPLLNLHLVIPH